jgi:hypothetical protein
MKKPRTGDGTGLLRFQGGTSDGQGSTVTADLRMGGAFIIKASIEAVGENRERLIIDTLTRWHSTPSADSAKKSRRGENPAGTRGQT